MASLKRFLGISQERGGGGHCRKNTDSGISRALTLKRSSGFEVQGLGLIRESKPLNRKTHPNRHQWQTKPFTQSLGGSKKWISRDPKNDRIP